jgi:hypothetical protein
MPPKTVTMPRPPPHPSSNIQKASPKAQDGLFQRLALAVSLGHALPIQKRASVGGDSKEGDEPAAGGDNTASIIDPVKRYLSYEKWCLDGELDPCFKDLSVWNLAMAVDASDPDEILAWGRTMLHNFRPNCIPVDGNTSIYVDVVDKEIAYTTALPLVLSLLASTADASTAKPNIIFTILDDLGYRNLGCYGSSSKNGDEWNRITNYRIT